MRSAPTRELQKTRAWSSRRRSVSMRTALRSSGERVAEDQAHGAVRGRAAQQRDVQPGRQLLTVVDHGGQGEQGLGAALQLGQETLGGQGAEGDYAASWPTGR